MAFEASALNVDEKTLLGCFHDDLLSFRICHYKSSIYCEEEHSHFKVPLILPPLPSGGSPEHWQTFLSSCFGRFLVRTGLQVVPKLSGGGCCSFNPEQSMLAPTLIHRKVSIQEKIELEMKHSITNIQAIPHFTGRESELAQITELLKTEWSVVISGSDISGKTALATSLAVKLARDFDIVWKFNYTTITAFFVSLEQLKLRLQAENHYLKVEDYVDSWKALLLLDNRGSNDFPYWIIQVAGRSGVKVLITQRGMSSRTMVTINGLDPKSAVDFVIGLTKRESEREDIELLCKELAYMPLALKNVSALLNFSPLGSVKQIIELVQHWPDEHRVNLIVKECISKVTSEAGRRLLQVTLNLSPEAIPELLYKEFFTERDADLEQAKKEVQALSLMEEDDHHNLSMHPIVLEEIRKYYPNQERELLPLTLQILLRLFDCTSISEQSLNLCTSMANLVENIKSKPTPEPAELILTIRYIYFCAEKLGDVKEAKDLCQKCSDLWWQSARVTAETVSDLEYLALCCKDARLFQIAVHYLRKIIDFRRRGSDRVKLAESFFNLGSVSDADQNRELAITYYMKALKLKESVLPPTDPSIAHLYEVCGVAYEKVNKWAEAEQFYLKAIGNLETYLPPIHPRIDSICSRLYLLYMDRGNDTKLEELLLTMLKDRETMLPPTHHLVFSVCELLRDLYLRLDTRSSRNKLEKLLLKMLEDREEVFPPTHREIGVVCAWLRDFYLDKKSSKALKYQMMAEKAEVSIAYSGLKK